MTQPGFSGTPLIVIDANGLTGDGFVLSSSGGDSIIRGFVLRTSMETPFKSTLDQAEIRFQEITWVASGLAVPSWDQREQHR